MNNARNTIAALAFAGCCLLSSVRLARDTPRPGDLRDSLEIAERSDERFAALRAALPDHGVVGYVGEPGAAAVGNYYLTQYALAPLVVDHSANHPLVIGNFPASPPPASQNLRLVKDFGDGVLLFANQDNQNKDNP